MARSVGHSRAVAPGGGIATSITSARPRGGRHEIDRCNVGGGPGRGAGLVVPRRGGNAQLLRRADEVPRWLQGKAVYKQLPDALRRATSAIHEGGGRKVGRKRTCTRTCIRTPGTIARSSPTASSRLRRPRSRRRN